MWCRSQVRVCVVSHRLGGLDGVSIEAAKWVHAFRSLGWTVTRAAGHFVDHEPTDVVVRGMWADLPGMEPPPVDADTIRWLCESHDLIVLDNAGSLWSAPEASQEWQRQALASRVPTIARHHDPAWQGVALRTPTPDTVPLHHPALLHVLINELTRAEFARRWPVLVERDALRIAHNRVDVDELAFGERDATRARLGVGPDDLVLVQPARVEAANKNVPGAVAFARQLARVVDRQVRYWLTDPAQASGAIGEALQEAPGLIRGHVSPQADMYAAADVVLLPSTWEGWGLPVVEGAAAGRLIVAGPYPVLDEIRAAGVEVYDPADVDEVAQLLADDQAHADVVDANRAVVRERFDLAALPGELEQLAQRAAQLMAG